MDYPNKFQCHYKLTVQWTDEQGRAQQAIVTDPITIQFNVSKALFQSVNTAQITVINLDGETRNMLYQDRLLFDKSKTKMLTLEAGYGDSLTTVCVGYIQQCYSERIGTDFKTQIDVLDPDILSQYTSVTFAAGTTFEEAYKYLASQMPNLKMGEFGGIEGEFATPTVFSGNTFTLIDKVTGGHVFIDNGTMNVLSNKSCLSNYGVYLIESETGLLGTPKRYDAILEINMLFEPTLRIGQLVEIKSETQSQFNGQYKINGITHNCTISGAVDGVRTTSIQLIYLDYITDSNVAYTGKPQGQTLQSVVNNNVIPLNTSVTADIQSVYNFIIKNKGKVPNVKCVGSIMWKDLIGHGNTDSERLSQLTLGYLANCKSLAEKVTEFRDRYFPNKSIAINSCWRSPQNNAREGGVDNSQHLRGRAIDLVIKGVNAATVYNTAIKSHMFTWCGKYSTFTHVDIRK